jgi:FtsH-binding integral membrane protein
MANPRNDTYLTAFFAWLIPGAGHWYIGDRKRAVIYFVSITLAFFIGLFIGGALSTVNIRTNMPWFFAEIFAGGYTLLSLLLGSIPGSAASYGKTLDLATIYVGVAGLLNLLVILDAVDRANPSTKKKTSPPEKSGGDQ